MSWLVAFQGLIGADGSVCRVTAQIPVVVSELFGNFPRLLLPQVLISTNSDEHSGVFTQLSAYLRPIGLDEWL